MSDDAEHVPVDLVRLDVADGVATLTLDSPANRNALSRRLVDELLTRLDEAAADDAVRVVVLAAAGGVFCSGADLAEASSQGMEEGSRRLVDLQRRVVAHPKPVVARVQGPVRAGGIGLVAACDVAICAEEATFALSEVRLGLAPAAISLSVLARLGSRDAAWVCLSGESFGGTRAAEIGLVSRAVGPEDLDQAVSAACASLLAASPQGLRETKALLNQDLIARMDERGEALAAWSARLFASPAATEAMAAFLRRT